MQRALNLISLGDRELFEKQTAKKILRVLSFLNASRPYKSAEHMKPITSVRFAVCVWAVPALLFVGCSHEKSGGNAQQKAEKKQPSQAEQKVVQLLHQDPQMRAAIINTVAVPSLTKCSNAA